MSARRRGRAVRALAGPVLLAVLALLIAAPAAYADTAVTLQITVTVPEHPASSVPTAPGTDSAGPVEPLPHTGIEVLRVLGISAALLVAGATAVAAARPRGARRIR